MGRRGRPAYDKYARVSLLLAALTERPQGLTRERLMSIIGLEPGRQRMFERDVRDARRAGWKIESRRVDDEYLYQIRVVDHRLRSMFSEDEAEQLLRAARNAGLGQLYEDLGAVRDGIVGRPDDARLDQVRYAIQHGCRLRFSYKGRSRDVHPYDVFHRPGRWYFRGREEGDDRVKNWKLTEVEELAVSGIGSADGVRDLPAPNLNPILHQRHDPVAVVIRVGDAYVEQVASMLGARGYRLLGGVDPGMVDIEFTVTNLESFLFRVYELGERVRLIGPDEVRRAAELWLLSVCGIRAGESGNGGEPYESPDIGPEASVISAAAGSVPGIVGADTPSTTGSAASPDPLVRGGARIESGLPGLLLPELGELLYFQDDPVSLATAAQELGESPDEIRRQVVLLHDLDATERFHRHGLDPRQWPIRIDQIHDEPGDEDLLVMAELEEILPGTEMFDAQVLGPLYVAAELLAMQEPGNLVLAAAAGKLRERFLPGFREASRFKSDVVQVVAAAIDDQVPVQITYARAWEPGVATRVIHPYELVAGRRGLEVDGEPAEKPGRVQTFLISNIDRARHVPGTFQRPEGIETRCQQHREERRVTGSVPETRRWVIEKWAEQVEFRPDRGGKVRFTATLVQPFEDRTAMMMLQAGPEASVASRPGERIGAGGPAARLAAALLDHHGLDQPGRSPQPPG